MIDSAISILPPSVSSPALLAAAAALGPPAGAQLLDFLAAFAALPALASVNSIDFLLDRCYSLIADFPHLSVHLDDFAAELVARRPAAL